MNGIKSAFFPSDYSPKCDTTVEVYSHILSSGRQGAFIGPHFKVRQTDIPMNSIRFNRLCRKLVSRRCEFPVSCTYHLVSKWWGSLML